MQHYKLFCIKTVEDDNDDSIFIEIHTTGNSYVEAYINGTKSLVDRYGLDDNDFTSINLSKTWFEED
jgi:hypothetical protein